MDTLSHKKIGELLIEAGLISTTQLQHYLDTQNQKRHEGHSLEETRLGQLIVQDGFLSKIQLNEFLAIQQTSSLQPSIEPSTEKSILSIFGEIESFSKNETPKKEEYYETQSSEKIGNFLAETKRISFSKENPRYEILKELGKGGMGVVQLAKDKLLGREVALKTILIKNALILNEKQNLLLWRLKQEASITSFLEHPNIVPLYDLQYENADKLQFTMRKIEGETLRTLLNKMKHEKKENKTQLLNIFLKVCDAIAYSHSRGVIHRDLKPDNIMIGSFGEVYVMDWGIAKRLKSPEDVLLKEEEENFSIEETHYKTRGGLGTPGYMPPEQQEHGANVTPQSDIYALGIILKECFTLVSPQEELRRMIDQVAHALKKTKKIQEKEWENVPLDIRAIVKKAIDPKAELRYLDIKTLAEDVQRYQNGLWVSVRRFNILHYLKKWLIRNKMFVSMSCITLVLLASVLMYKDSLQKKERKTQYQNFIQKAENEETLSLEATQEHRMDKSLEIGHLINALDAYNKALETKIDIASTEQKKYALAKKLLASSLDTKNYDLAHYVAKEINKLSYRPDSESTDYFEQIEKKRHQVLTAHEKKLEAWLKRAKPSEDPQWKALENSESLDFLFEISQMKEEEIFQKLLQEFQSGAQMMVEEPIETRSSKQEEYHYLIVAVLGRIGNKKAEEPVFETFEKMSQKIFKTYDQHHVPDSELHYIIALVEALGNLKAYSFSEKLDEIRILFGEEHIFWKRTQLSSKKLIQGKIEQFDQALQIKPHDAELYYQRGLSKFSHEDLDGSIQDFDEAIRIAPEFYNAYFSRAQSKYKKKDFHSAIQDLNIVLQLEEKNKKKIHETYHARGNAKREIKDFEGAILDYNQAISFKKDYVDAYNHRGLAKYFKNDFEGAILDYNQAILLNPKYTSAHLNLGNIKTTLNDFESAMQHYNQAIELEPEDERAYYNRALLKTRKKDWDGAIEDFNSTIRINPNQSNAYHQRGEAKIQKNDPLAAIQDYTEAIRLSTTEKLKLYAKRGVLYAQIRRFKDALQDYDQAIALSPQADLYCYRGKIKANMGKIQEALSDYNTAIQLDSKHVSAHFFRGELFFQQGQVKKAIEDFNIAIPLAPNDSALYYNRGNARHQLKDFKGALQDFTEAIRLTPQYSQLYYCRGNVKFDLQDVDSALQDYTEAIQRQPGFIEAHENRGILYLEKGDFEAALQDFNQILQINPQEANAYAHRGNIKAQQGDLDSALSDWDQAVRLNPNDQESAQNKTLILNEIKKQYLEHLKQKEYSLAKEKILLLQKHIPEKKDSFEKELQKIKALMVQEK